MSDDTLLAHLSRRLGHGTENLATEALEYVLRHEQVAAAFHRHLRQFAPDIDVLTRFRTQVTGSDDTGVRDLVGTTSTNTTPLVVEVKFDAPLTVNQPGTYLRALSELDQPSLLLFLVPTTKVEPLWPRLVARAADDGFPIEQTAARGAGPIGRHRQTTLAVTTWARLLDDLSGIPLGEANQQVLGELRQLRGLCDRQDREGFLPFDRAFLEGETGRHLLDLDSLLISAVNLLRKQKKAVTERFKWTGAQGFYGKYFGLAGRNALLHVNFARWGTQADTPLWLQVWSQGDPRVADVLAPLRAVEPRQLFDDDGKLMMPIRLRAGADRDECLNTTIDFISRVYDLLVDLPPMGDPPDVDDVVPDDDELGRLEV